MTPPWIREDTTEADSPKVLRLIELAGYEAYHRLHALKQWCGRHRSGGAFSNGVVKQLNTKPNQIAAMITVELVDTDGNGGYRFLDWEKANPSTTNAERQKRYRERRRDA